MQTVKHLRRRNRFGFSAVETVNSSGYFIVPSCLHRNVWIRLDARQEAIGESHPLVGWQHQCFLGKGVESGGHGGMLGPGGRFVEKEVGR